jgi:chorismate synthase
MKNLMLKLMVAVFFTALISFPIGATGNKAKTLLEKSKTEMKTTVSGKSSAEISAEVDNMILRLNEIKEMDFKALNPTEKKELRKEIKSIRNNLKSYGESNAKAKAAAEGGATRGIFISTGAAIIIVLLLILLI